jgi:hypothetical protein
MKWFKSRFAKKLAAGMKPGGDLIGALREVEDFAIAEEEDARAFADFMKTIADRYQANQLRAELPLRSLIGFFQNIETKETGRILKSLAIPHLIRLFDGQFRLYRQSGLSSDETDDLMVVLTLLAFYQTAEGTQRVIDAARLPLEPNAFLWKGVFENFFKGHEFSHLLCDRLRKPLPPGSIRLAYLDFCNTLGRDGELASHPFDTPEGHVVLERWLVKQADAEEGDPICATASLPFISNPKRDQLLALAMDHPKQDVQIEAGWASARMGSEAGIRFLARLSCDPRTSKTACSYLEELGRADAIPEEAEEPDFVATAEMASWLSHPSEFGEPPDEIDVYNSCKLFWPPSNDRRRVWLVRYRYRAGPNREQEEIGVGMVGSTTFALFGETTVEMSPDEIYALHCCWELQTKRDPRAPRELSVKAGKRILDKYN